MRTVYLWPIHNWSSTGFQTLDSFSKVSLSKASAASVAILAQDACT